MFLLGLLLPVCYVSGYTGASIETQWALLSLVLPLALWKSGALSSLHWIGLGFMSYAALGLLWAPNTYDAVYGLWFVVLWGLAFWFGYTTTNPRGLYKGLAMGLSVSSIVAVFQWYGFAPVLTFANGTNPSGLLFNSTLLATCIALVSLALATEGLWLWIIPMLPALYLANSKGAYMALAFAGASRIHWLLALFIAFVGANIAVHLTNGGSLQRIEILHVALNGLTPFGWGPGSFRSVYYITGSSAVRPEFVHNDYIQLWFEFGVASVLLLVVFAFAIIWANHPALYAVACLAAYYFPLYAPIPAFLAFFIAGHSLRGFDFDVLVIRHCRPDLLPRSADPEHQYDPAWSEAVPVQPRT